MIIDAKLLKKAKSLGESQAPLEAICAQLGFEDYTTVAQAMQDRADPNHPIYLAILMGRNIGIARLAKAQYNAALKGRTKQLDNLLLTKGAKYSDGFESQETANHKAKQQPTYIDLAAIDTIEKARALVSDIALGKLVISMAQQQALKLIIDSFKASTVTIPADSIKLNLAS